MPSRKTGLTPDEVAMHEQAILEYVASTVSPEEYEETREAVLAYIEKEERRPDPIKSAHISAAKSQRDKSQNKAIKTYSYGQSVSPSAASFRPDSTIGDVLATRPTTYVAEASVACKKYSTSAKTEKVAGSRRARRGK